MIGKVAVSNLRTKLILHTEVLHRSETANLSARMEIEGTRRSLRWVIQHGLRLRSLTTDRSRAIGRLLNEMKGEIGQIQHFYDGWHMVKWLGNRLREESRRSGCAPIAVWRENVKTHLWRSIKDCAGQGDMVRHVFNTCLMHVKDVHSWTTTPETGPYTRCNHGPLEGTRPEVMLEGSEAYTRFRNVVLNQRLQEDLTKASPYGGTSVCESKNALDRLYCRKEIFYPISTYPFYIKLATMHFSCLRLAEIAGERTVEKRAQITEVPIKDLSACIEDTSSTPLEGPNIKGSAEFEKKSARKSPISQRDREHKRGDGSSHGSRRRFRSARRRPHTSRARLGRHHSTHGPIYRRWPRI